MKMILSCFAVFMLISFDSAAAKISLQPNLLELPVTMKVYAAETLESIIFRLDSHSGQRIEFSSQMLQGYKAKATDYRNVPIRQVLQEQLAGTHLKFHLYKRRIWLTDEKAAIAKRTRRF